MEAQHCVAKIASFFKIHHNQTKNKRESIRIRNFSLLCLNIINLSKRLNYKIDLVAAEQKQCIPL